MSNRNVFLPNYSIGGSAYDEVIKVGNETAMDMSRKVAKEEGILGGISSGQTIRVAIALKPTASITTSGKTINMDRQDTDVLTKGRHDPCVGVRATPIAEAMLAIVLMDHFMRDRAQNADVVAPFAPIEPK